MSPKNDKGKAHRVDEKPPAPNTVEPKRSGRPNPEREQEAQAGQSASNVKADRPWRTYEFWDKRLTLAALLIVVVLTFLSYRQTTRATEESNRLTRESNEIARKALVADKAPKLVVHAMGVDKANAIDVSKKRGLDHVDYSIIVDINNAGETAAIDMQVIPWVTIIAQPYYGTLRYANLPTSAAKFSLPPGESISGTGHVPIPFEALDAIMVPDGDAMLLAVRTTTSYSTPMDPGVRLTQDTCDIWTNQKNFGGDDRLISLPCGANQSMSVVDASPGKPE